MYFGISWPLIWDTITSEESDLNFFVKTSRIQLVWFSFICQYRYLFFGFIFEWSVLCLFNLEHSSLLSKKKSWLIHYLYSILYFSPWGRIHSLPTSVSNEHLCALGINSAPLVKGPLHGCSDALSPVNWTLVPAQRHSRHLGASLKCMILGLTQTCWIRIFTLPYSSAQWRLRSTVLTCTFSVRVILHSVLHSVPRKLTGVQREDQGLEIIPRSSM